MGSPGAVLISTAEAEDVTQEIFLRLWNDPDRFDSSRGSLRSFLLTQAHGRVVDAVRSLTARHRREVQEAQRTAASSYDLEHEVWDLALEDRVSKALDELPGEERRAIELAYFKGYTYVEVAQSLGQPEGTIKSRIRNGMQSHACRARRGRDPGGRRVITHDQAHDLLAAFALDAVDGGIEHDQIESHLNECPRCATEIVALRDVASALGNCVEPVPERLWSVISSRLSVSKQEEPAPPLLKVLPSRTGRTEKAPRIIG